MRVPSLLCGRMSEWYRLSAAGGDPNLRIYLKRDVWEELLRINWQEVVRRNGFPVDVPFHDCRDATAFFGFNGVASYLFHGLAEDRSSNVVLDFDLKTARYDPVSGWKKPDDPAAFHLSATLNLLFAALGLCKGRDDEGSQLVTIDGFVSQPGTEGGGSLIVMLSSDLMEWLSQRGQCEDWPELLAPAKAAYRAMAGDEPSSTDMSGFRIHIDLPTGVRLQVPPDEGMLWMTHLWEPGHAAELPSHEVNSLVSQIILLVILGRLCDLYRQDVGIA